MSTKAIRMSYAPGQEVALDYGDCTLWRYHFATDHHQPSFYPLTAPNGIALACRPSTHEDGDCGLLFAWRSINGAAYHNGKTEPSQPRGTLEFVGPEDIEAGPKEVLISTHYHYHGPSDNVVMHDTRIIAVAMPENDTYFVMDWNLAFTPTEDIRIEPIERNGDRCSGLFWRAHPGLDQLTLHSSSGRAGETSAGQPANWVDLRGTAGGGRDGTGGMALMVHPSTPRSPARWNATAQTGFACLNPTPVLDDALELAAGEVLRLRYRALVHDGSLSPETIEEHYQRYARADA